MRTAEERERMAAAIDAEGMPYVGFGGKWAHLKGDRFELGFGIRRPSASWRRPARWGRWFYFFALGYVNGFPVPAIIYWVLTRRMGATVWHWTWVRERMVRQMNGIDGVGVCDPRCRRCAR